MGTETVDTLVVGAGQAGLATSYWLNQAGIAHLLVDRREALGGAWQDRWDSFRLVTPNFALQLPGMPYDGPDPNALSGRDAVIELFRDYAGRIAAPVRLATEVTGMEVANGGFLVHAQGASISAHRVVLATGPFQVPSLPAAAAGFPESVRQLHSNDYRQPGQLPEGAVLVVGTGQSGTQIASELLSAGRRVHVAVSSCTGAPRSYRGRNLYWWLMQVLLRGPELGMKVPTVDDLPTPAARFECHPHLFEDSPRRLAERGAVLHGKVLGVEGSTVGFGDDVARKVAFAETDFDVRFRPMFDAYAAATGLELPQDPPATGLGPVPEGGIDLDMDAEGIAAVVWATGYRLDFSWLGLPILDEWGYPLHRRGVTVQPGLYAIGLPWLHTEPSAVIPGVGADAAHLVERMVAAG
ncbi:NAD(P)/FAD-dependent oxidoreductase [Paeniglutamicibacter psychrophenolicus]|uniref:Flavoprotein involved in K+ transport n=1 Tax=Paeniglutamicibacter psychrophenolicus TaxID=257454 RepID=A0ABS4W804_9MICC|nr:NAD(P)/FAD-dependent oxidoreductase [Paeniglutamicibacter psychrophenolicus]MBP2372334.1 putative flavoprotein involved in K+ transport [Paeniglutamicibacter psychrophenolicus]